MRRPLVLAFALLAAACAPSGAAIRATSPAVSPTPTVAEISARLTTAQNDMFANRYAAADDAYATLLTEAAKSSSVHAALALFLNYRSDPADALAQARMAVSLDRSSGTAEAVLCRVDDWSGYLPDAVGAGRAAVALDASDPLAHLFLAEALADSGDLAGSQSQLDAANGLIVRQPSPFLRAEALREAANLDGDSGKRDAQVAALQQARDLQSGWLYRTSELVEAEVSAGQNDAARQTLESVTAQSPDDFDTLQTLGDDALFVGDGQAALTLWQRALAIDPTSVTALDAVGELEVAAKNDVNSAVSDFERALTIDPSDDQAAAYLVALARYVQKKPEFAAQEIASAIAKDANAHSVHPPPAPQPDLLQQQAASKALAAVNAVRAAAGLPPVHLDNALGASATSHSFYWLFNNVSPSVAGLGIHQETPGLPGYSGMYPWDRAVAFGYPNQRIGEDITHQDTPGAAVNDWVDSVYHRFAILRPDLTAVGYGQADVGSLLMEDMEFGFAPPSSAVPVLYPAAGQTSVATTFVDNELPDPVPAGDPRTTGYPVTVTFSVADGVALSSFTLSDPSGVAVPAYVLSPSTSTENSASLLPVSPLHTKTSYTARIVASIDGRPYDTTWSFTTAS
ncbi:MAG: hypothetical protein JOY80_07130 [Candidatus Dormibacteraeota bacterium]|nr:hypothetical protein [Candidatus Dormibacteraeota bacterium]